MKFLYQFDLWLLKKCGKFAWRVQTQTGVTSYHIAAMGIGMSVGSSMFTAVNCFCDFPMGRQPPYMAVLPFLWIWILRDDFLALRKAYRYWQEGSAHLPIAMIARLYPAGRIFWYIFVAATTPLSTLIALGSPHPFWAFIISNGVPMGMLIFLIFVAIHPNPPGKSKVREWMENFGRTLTPARVNT